MTEQLDLLAPVHAYDGAESRIAAERVNSQHQYELVLLCLLGSSEPLTDDEIAERCGLLRHSAGTRRGIAVKRGHVRKDGVGVSAYGNPAGKWRLTEAGEQEARRIRAAS